MVYVPDLMQTLRGAGPEHSAPLSAPETIGHTRS
jgi:hypothetical protein